MLAAERQYDGLNRLTSTRRDTEGLNLQTSVGYDPAGNIEQVTDPRGIVTAYAYDPMNRRIAAHQDATGRNLTTGYDYGRLGHLQTITDAHGVVNETTANAFGSPLRTVQDVNGIAAVTRSVYHLNQNQTAVIDANGNATHYTYDPGNQLTQTRYADHTTVGLSYTPRGDIWTRTDQTGATVNYQYDTAGRLTGKTFPGGSQTFTYTANRRLNTAAQTMSGHTTNVAFDYDAMGSVTAVTQTLDGLTWTTGNAYDYAAGLVTITYPSGAQVMQQQDALHHLATVQQNGLLVSNYTYNGPADVYQYDALNQLTQVWYGADATDPAAMTTSDQQQSYTLDPVGNRLTVQNDGLPRTYRPNNGQQLLDPLHRYAQVGNAALSYDVKGNLLSDGRNSYTYDLFNRQITMTGPGGNAEYMYDALGRRVTRIVDNLPTYVVYNASYQVIEERNATNALGARYTYGAGIDEELTLERGGHTYT